MKRVEVEIIKGKLDGVTMLIALAAIVGLFISGFQSCQLQDHFEMANRPHLNYNAAFASGSDGFWGVGLSNGGPGSAKVMKVSICLDGERLHSENGNGWRELRADLGLEPWTLYYNTMHAGDVIRTAEDKKLFGFVTKPKDESDRQLVRDAALRFDYIICYCSFLDECESLSARFRGPRVRSAHDTCEDFEPVCLDSLNLDTRASQPAEPMPQANG